MFCAGNYHPVMLELRLAQGREEARTIIMEMEERREERGDLCLGAHLLLLGWTCFNILILPHLTEV